MSLKDYLSAIQYEYFTGNPGRVIIKLKSQESEESDSNFEEPAELVEDSNPSMNLEEEEVDIGERKRNLNKPSLNLGVYYLWCE